MNVEQLRAYCLAKAATTESFPFDNDTLVFKVAGKMFALVSLERIPPSVNLKCDPERAVRLRETYAAVGPGYHMNKRHWNTVMLESDLDADRLRELIDHSYELVVGGLPKKIRAALEAPGSGGKS